MLNNRSRIKKIPMLNLIRQQEMIRERLYPAVEDVINSGIYISQEKVTLFEAKLANYCRRPHAVGVGSGTAALHIALCAVQVRPGDEVITVPNSFFATAEAVLQVGAIPVFVDIVPDTHLMDLDKLEGAVTEKTRAVLPVHLYGNIVDIARLQEILDNLGRSDIAIIEDCAHAPGAWFSDKPTPIGEIGAFSFNPSKNIGAFGDAGAIVTSHEVVAARSRLLRDHGRQDPNTHILPGFNSRLSRLNDRVLSVKIDYLDAWNNRRRDIARRYSAAFKEIPDIQPVVTAPEVQSAFHQYVVCTPRRDDLGQFLAQRGVATAIHYPKLIPKQLACAERGYMPDDLTVAIEKNRQILSLPCYAELTDEEVDHIIGAVRDFFQEPYK